FLNTFTLTLDDYRYPFFQTEIRPFFIIIASFYLGLLLYLLFHNYKKLYIPSKESKLTLVFLFSFLVITFLSVRFYDPITPLVKAIYLSPVFIFFRSPEKIFLLVPFFYCSLVAFLLRLVKFKNQYQFYGGIVL